MRASTFVAAVVVTTASLLSVTGVANASCTQPVDRLGCIEQTLCAVPNRPAWACVD
ncbi:MAG: hypothetical protein M3273_06320 [Actinomycetota bacterium]|nr:hypothetical protein [Actinomycetota bacterium]